MLIAVYGSLRRDMYNHADYLGGQIFKGVETIYGFEMFSLGNFPYIIRGTSKVTFEIYEVSDKLGRSIRDMELGSNYEESEVETEFGTAKIYQMSPEQHAWYGRHRPSIPVPNGDWVYWFGRGDDYPQPRTSSYGVYSADPTEPFMVRPMFTTQTVDESTWLNGVRTTIEVDEADETDELPF